MPYRKNSPCADGMPQDAGAEKKYTILVCATHAATMQLDAVVPAFEARLAVCLKFTSLFLHPATYVRRVIALKPHKSIQRLFSGVQKACLRVWESQSLTRESVPAVTQCKPSWVGSTAVMDPSWAVEEIKADAAACVSNCLQSTPLVVCNWLKNNGIGYT